MTGCPADAPGLVLQPPFVVTEVFTGRYDVTASSERRLQGDDGWCKVRLTVDGRGVVSAYDS